MLGLGWAVVATDYPGLGTPGPHAYLVGNAGGYAVLDSVRAARHVPRAGAGSRFVVWGLSQGAHAALFTGQLASRYAPDLQLTGVVAAAPPTDLVANLGGDVDPTVRTVLTAFTAASWSRVYNVSLATIARPVGRRVEDIAAEGRLWASRAAAEVLKENVSQHPHLARGKMTRWAHHK
jgi:acetyl esterase/lipase